MRKHCVYKSFEEALLWCCDLVLLWPSGFLLARRIPPVVLKGCSGEIWATLVEVLLTFQGQDLSFLMPSVSLSFSKTCTTWSQKTVFWGCQTAVWIQPLAADIPMRLTTFPRWWLMLWCRPNTWKYLYYLSSGSPCLITSAKCFGMLMMCTPRPRGVLQDIPAGWPCLGCPPWGTQLAYGHVLYF